MIPTGWLRAALLLSAPANLVVAWLLLRPDSVAGRWLELPAQVPVLYRLMPALFVALFGGAYAWLAWQPRIDRPLLALATVGKFAAFAGSLALWFASAVSNAWMLLISVDLALVQRA